MPPASVGNVLFPGAKKFSSTPTCPGFTLVHAIEPLDTIIAGLFSTISKSTAFLSTITTLVLSKFASHLNFV